MALFAGKLHRFISTLQAALESAEADLVQERMGRAADSIAHLQAQAEAKERYDGALAGRDEVIDGLRTALATETKRATGLEGGLAALQEHVTTTETRLGIIERGHHWRIGAAVDAHEGGKAIAYECTCGARVMGPEGFFERKG